MRTFLGFTLVLTASLALAACGGNVSDTGGSAGSTSTGGTSSGGTGGATGGTSTGGTSTGGTSTGGATGGTSTGGTGPAAPQCTTDAAPCQLVNDCCHCLGIGPGEAAPTCDIPECFVDTCTGEGLAEPQTPQCAAGQCVAGFVCTPDTVVCETDPPSCPSGQVPSVAGDCWGGCVPATECLSVPGCDSCKGGLACVLDETLGGFVAHCVAPPAACAGTPTCECMGAAVCAGTYHLCSQPGGPLQCSCPEC